MGIQAFLTTPIMHLQQETEIQLTTQQPKEVESSDARCTIDHRYPHAVLYKTVCPLPGFLLDKDNTS